MQKGREMEVRNIPHIEHPEMTVTKISLFSSMSRIEGLFFFFHLFLLVGG